MHKTLWTLGLLGTLAGCGGALNIPTSTHVGSPSSLTNPNNTQNPNGQNPNVGNPNAANPNATALPKSALFALPTGDDRQVSVILTDDPNGFCADINAGVMHKSTQYGVFGFVTGDNPNAPGTAALLPTGAYKIVDPNVWAVSKAADHDVLAGFAGWDSTCQSTNGGNATSGNANVTVSNANTLSVGYDYSIAGKHYTGNFNATVCPPPANPNAPIPAGQCK